MAQMKIDGIYWRPRSLSLGQGRLSVLGTAKTILRDTAKTVAFAAMGNGPWLRRKLHAVRKTGVATILNLHRVANDDGSDYRPLDPTLFDELLAFAKREFAVVTINELQEKTRKSKLVLSFDDGYRDFVTTAVPILRKHGLRANQNISTMCRDRRPATQRDGPGLCRAGAAGIGEGPSRRGVFRAGRPAVRAALVAFPEDAPAG
jgi:hypothetical protein